MTRARPASWQLIKSIIIIIIIVIIFFIYYYYSFINITTIITQLTVNGKKIMKVPSNQFRARKSPERQLHYTAVQ
jgi:hypothetical protein